MSVVCLGKLSKYYQLESYLSSAIGASSRKRSSGVSKHSKFGYYQATSSANASGGEPVESPVRLSGSGLQFRTRLASIDAGTDKRGDLESGDFITVRTEVVVSRELERPEN